MATDEKEGAKVSAESPLDVQTAQQPKDALVAQAGPPASAFQKKKRQVTSVGIYSPHSVTGGAERGLSDNENPSRRLEPLQAGTEYQRARNLTGGATLSAEAENKSRC